MSAFAFAFVHLGEPIQLIPVVPPLGPLRRILGDGDADTGGMRQGGRAETRGVLGKHHRAVGAREHRLPRPGGFLKAHTRPLQRHAAVVEDDVVDQRRASVAVDQRAPLDHQRRRGLLRLRGRKADTDAE